MRSRTPKVLHEVAGQPSLHWVLDACRDAGCEQLWVVVGSGADEVRAAYQSCDDLQWVTQHQQQGTGHAVQVALTEIGRARSDGTELETGSISPDATVLIVYADNPLMTTSSLRRLAEAAEEGWAALSVATVEQPGALGRVVANADGQLEKIVEFADANEAERTIRQVNAGQYAVQLRDFGTYLDRLESGNAQGELYLTDAFMQAAHDGRAVRCLELPLASEAWGINDRADLARAHRELQRRLIESHLESGVTILDPERTTIGPAVRIDPDVVLHPDVWLGGATRIARGCELHQGAWVRDSELAEDVEVHPYSLIDGAQVSARCSIGPFARLRPAAELGEEVRIGNFVEVKKSRLGSGAKANHLAYLGDATVGERVNIGAGVVTCNYDGKDKHHTTIGEDAFVGSDCMLVAPVSVGARAITGAGSVITDDVPEDSLALGRARQRNLVGWTKKRRGEDDSTD